MSENKTTFRLRQGTQDPLVFQEVITDNQYRLRDKLPADGAIIDIGANIGAFAVACLTRGAGNVLCIEPDVGCFNLLCQNVSAWRGKVDVLNAAVWRKDEPAVFNGYADKTACGYLAPQRLLKVKQVSVPTTDLDSIIESVTADGSRLRLLKIDAEGSEYPSLYTSTMLDKVDEIVGETHSMIQNESTQFTYQDYYGFTADRCCIKGMVDFLQQHGFTVSFARESNDSVINHLFWASRPSAPERLCHF